MNDSIIAPTMPPSPSATWAALPVDLALRGAGADGSPGDQVGDELGSDRVEELATRGQPELDQIEEELPRQPQAFVDGERVVEMGVVDQALPPDSRARLLEVDA